MNKEPLVETKYAAILLSLANGVDPVTGAVMPASHFLHSNDVVHALHFAADAIRAAAKSRANAGKPWTADMDRQLLSLAEQKIQPVAIAFVMGRTPVGIEARLEYHELKKRRQQP